MGGGKSYFLRWWCIRECIRLFATYGVRGVRIGLFSMDYPTLLDRQISRMVFEIPEHIGKIQKTQTDGFNLTLVPELGGGTVALRNLDNPSKYNSAEFAGIAIEELTENPEAIFHELRKRIRWPGVPASDMHFVAAANPGGIGHAWVKKLWIDRDFPTEMRSMAGQFAYVPAKAQDNPHLDPAYYAQLLSLPEEMRKAYAEGSWDIFAGQYFKEWRKDGANDLRAERDGKLGCNCFGGGVGASSSAFRVPRGCVTIFVPALVAIVAILVLEWWFDR